MGKRLILCLAGAALGAAVSSTVNNSLGFSPGDAMAICSVAGLAVGYVAATLLDVFTTKSDPLAVIRPD